MLGCETIIKNSFMFVHVGRDLYILTQGINNMMGSLRANIASKSLLVYVLT